VKIAVMSDSHDHTEHIDRVAAAANEAGCAGIFHLGDVVSPFAVYHLRPFRGQVRAVFGNNDGELFGVQAAFKDIGGEIRQPPWDCELAGKRILMLHEPILLEALVKSQEYDFIFYGHLHEVDCRRTGRTLVLSPGETAGWVKSPGFYIVNVSSGECERIELARS